MRTICRRCVICRKAAAVTKKQMMGQLPSQRVTPSPPFSRVGIDYAGPLTIKKGHTRKPVYIKAYICIFVCFATKAANLEVVSDLTTEAFLACLQRFTSRRGLPLEIFSDNGTNFVGTSNELKDLYSYLCSQPVQDSITNTLSTQRIQWHFSPERSPHFGGLWEAAVKSTKAHLKRVVGQQKLTYEELSTVLCRIESCLNS